MRRSRLKETKLTTAERNLKRSLVDKFEEHVLKWYNKDVYSRLGSDVSVTELLLSPRQVHLANRYRHLKKEDTVDKILPALIGMGLHDQLQRFLKLQGTLNKDWMIERKLLTVIDGVRITGRFDAMYNNEDLYDIKVTKAYKALKGDYSDWEKQLNAYDYMLWKDGISVKTLKICMVLLDWNLGESWKTEYPNTRLSIVPITKWDRAEQESWMKTTIKSWKDAKDLSDSDLPLCTSGDRWADDPKYKLYRTKKLKKATKVFPTQQRAQAYLDKCKANEPDKWKNGYIVADRANGWRKCESFCHAKDYCNQYQNKLE